MFCLSSSGGGRGLQCLLLALALTATTAAAWEGTGGGGRLHPPGWYLQQFRRWAAEHNVSLPYEADAALGGGAFRRRLAVWSDNKLVASCVCVYVLGLDVWVDGRRNV